MTKFAKSYVSFRCSSVTSGYLSQNTGETCFSRDSELLLWKARGKQELSSLSRTLARVKSLL